MKPTIYTVGNISFGFSLDSIRERYSNKDDFIRDVYDAHDIDKAKLKKVLDKVWKEAFPQKENNEKGAE